MSRGIINEGLETLAEPENRERVGRIVNSPQMRAAIHDLTGALVEGVVDGIESAGASGKVDVSRSLARSLDKRLTPALGRLAARVVGDAIAASLTDAQIARMEVLSTQVGQAMIRGIALGIERDLGPALATTIERDLGPALASMIERDLVPAVGRALETPELQAALTSSARAAATGIVEGAGEAFDVKTASDKAEGKQSGLQLFGDRVALGYGIVLFVAFSFGALVVVLTVLLVRFSRRLRKQSESAKQREAALMGLVESLESDRPELRAHIQELMHSQLNNDRP